MAGQEPPDQRRRRDERALTSPSARQSLRAVELFGPRKQPRQVDEIDRRHTEVVDRHVQGMEDGGVRGGQNERVGFAHPERLCVAPDGQVVDPAADHRCQRHVQIDLDARPRPGHLVVVGLVEPGCGGAWLESEAVEHCEGRAAVLVPDQQIDVGRRTCARHAVEPRLVVEPLEDDGRDARRGERPQALLGDLPQNHVAGSGDDAIAPEGFGQSGGEAATAGDRKERRETVVPGDCDQRRIIGPQRGRPRRIGQRRQQCLQPLALTRCGIHAVRRRACPKMAINER